VREKRAILIDFGASDEPAQVGSKIAIEFESDMPAALRGPGPRRRRSRAAMRRGEPIGRGHVNRV